MTDEPKLPKHKDKDQLRRDWQKLKGLNQANFWRQWNEAHSQAYYLAEKHYREALFIYLPKSMQDKIIAKATEIRELWEGIDTIIPAVTEGTRSPEEEAI
jgi:hypothetical protein